MRVTADKAVAGFAAWAATYDQTIARDIERVFGITYAQVLQHISEAMNPMSDARVLDLGTGTGALALLIARQLGEGQVVGIDPTGAMLSQARENVQGLGLAGRVELCCASAEALPFADASFDAVISSIAMHHTQVQQTLREIVRILKPAGRLVIADTARNLKWNSYLGTLAVPVLLVLYYLIIKRSLPIVRAELAAYKQLFLKSEWEAMLTEAGLRTVELYEVTHPAYAWYPAMLFIHAQK